MRRPHVWSASQASTSPLEQARERGLKHAKHALRAWASSWCSFSLTGLGWPRFLSAPGTRLTPPWEPPNCALTDPTPTLDSSVR